MRPALAPLLLLLTACGRLLGPVGSSPKEEDALERGPSEKEGADERSLPAASSSAPPDSSAPAADSGAPDVVADSIADFSSVQGDRGWRYGFVAPAAGPDLVELEAFTSGAWVLPGTWLSLTRDVASPHGTQNGGVERWAVRRWTSDISGPVRIAVRFFKTETSCGNGAEGRIVVDGALVWEAFVPYEDAAGTSSTIDAALSQGSTVDLVLDPYQGNDACDHVHLSMVVRTAR